MTPPHQISVSELSRLIGTPSAPAIIDVCIDEDFNADPRLVPTSVRHPHMDITTLVPHLGGRHATIICQKGLKLSQGAAAMLRAHGVAARYLEGGVFAWQDAGQPLIPADTIPPRNEAGQTVWVTHHRPTASRIACAWLIRRFVDPGAAFLFVDHGQVADVANRFGCVPFDVEDMLWSYRGEKCTFETMIEALSLMTEPLKQLAKIVRGADTNCHDLAPEAAGLRAALLGVSQMHQNDLDQLDAGLVLCDALYRWSRDVSHEGRSRPATATKAG